MIQPDIDRMKSNFGGSNPNSIALASSWTVPNNASQFQGGGGGYMITGALGGLGGLGDDTSGFDIASIAGWLAAIPGWAIAIGAGLIIWNASSDTRSARSAGIRAARDEVREARKKVSEARKVKRFSFKRGGTVSRTTHREETQASKQRLNSYLGTRMWKEGEEYFTGIDSSVFDSLTDAKEFVRSVKG